MSILGVTKVIAVEEHFMSLRVNEQYKKIAARNTDDPAALAKSAFIDAFVEKGIITEIGEKRLEAMDKSGVDIQLISYGNNSPMYLDAEYALPLCRQANNDLAYCCQADPKRLYGFAVLPIADITAALAEMERCKKELGFKGIIFNGTYKGKFLDDEIYLPIYQKAAELKMPIQFHPGEVDSKVSEHYYQGSWPMTVTNVFAGHGIGWHYDSGIQYIRMILSGIFDKVPNLTLLCGHWGELIPYYFNRLDTTLTPEVTGLKHPISYYFKKHMYITPSGMFFDDDFEFCLKKVGADHILWATDYPYRIEGNSKEYLNNFNLTKEEREMIAHRNAEDLFDLR